MTWDDIARQCKTDKASWLDDGHDGVRVGHGYMQHYEDLLAKRNVQSMVEIGIDRGASLRTWAKIWPDATILGIDVDSSCATYVEGYADVLIADVADHDALEPIRDERWDLVIDDGSHRLQDIAAALPYFARRLNRTGIYAIEDVILGPSLWPAASDEVLRMLPQFGLQVLAVHRSSIPFVQADVHKGDFGLILAEKL